MKEYTLKILRETNMLPSWLVTDEEFLNHYPEGKICIPDTPLSTCMAMQCPVLSKLPAYLFQNLDNKTVVATEFNNAHQRIEGAKLVDVKTNIYTDIVRSDVIYSNTSSKIVFNGGTFRECTIHFKPGRHYIRNMCFRRCTIIIDSDLNIRDNMRMIGCHVIVNGRLDAKYPLYEHFDNTYEGDGVFSGYIPMQAKVKEPRSQKLKGVMALLGLNRGYDWTVPNVLSVAPYTDLPTIYPAFARPCPTRPRHGFVDSKLVRNEEEARAIVKETLEHDNNGEVIFMEPVRDRCSAVWTNGSLSLGAGNDGATSGKQSYVFPLNYESNRRVIDKPKHYYSVKEDEDCFVEIVYDVCYKANVVQVRGGPEISSSLDFIPRKTEVKRILEPVADLLEWEMICQNAEEGDVICVPGMAMSSHFAIHGVLNKIPVITSKQVCTGDILEAEEGGTEIVPDNVQFRRGFDAAILSHTDVGSWVYSACSIIHNSYAFQQQNRWFELGLACGLMTRAAFILCLGEARYAEGQIMGRDCVYNKHSRSNWADLMDATVEARELFEDTCNWSDGFGGRNWLRCVEAFLEVYRMRDSFESCFSEANNALHMAHNGGWLFNKVCDAAFLDNIASNTAETSAFMGAYIWDCVVPIVKLRDADIKKSPSIPKFTYFGHLQPVYRECCDYGAFWGDTEECGCEQCTQCGEHIDVCDCCPDCHNTNYDCECCSDCLKYICECEDE